MSQTWRDNMEKHGDRWEKTIKTDGKGNTLLYFTLKHIGSCSVCSLPHHLLGLAHRSFQSYRSQRYSHICGTVCHFLAKHHGQAIWLSIPHYPQPKDHVHHHNNNNASLHLLPMDSFHVYQFLPRRKRKNSEPDQQPGAEYRDCSDHICRLWYFLLLLAFKE